MFIKIYLYLICLQFKRFNSKYVLKVCNSWDMYYKLFFTPSKLRQISDNYLTLWDGISDNNYILEGSPLKYKINISSFQL